jgi:hypothetical protein
MGRKLKLTVHQPRTRLRDVKRARPWLTSRVCAIDNEIGEAIGQRVGSETPHPGVVWMPSHGQSGPSSPLGEAEAIAANN